MQKFSFIVKDPDGVHARPAGIIIKAITPFKSNVSLETNGKKVLLKGGIFALMGLGIRQGQALEVTVEGEDELEAVDAVRKAFEDNL